MFVILTIGMDSYACDTEPRALEYGFDVHGKQGRFDAAFNHPNDDYEQVWSIAFPRHLPSYPRKCTAPFVLV